MQLNSNIPDGPLDKKWDNHKFNLKLVNPSNRRKYTVYHRGDGPGRWIGGSQSRRIGL